MSCKRSNVDQSPKIWHNQRQSIAKSDDGNEYTQAVLTANPQTVRGGAGPWVENPSGAATRKACENLQRRVRKPVASTVIADEWLEKPSAQRPLSSCLPWQETGWHRGRYAISSRPCRDESFLSLWIYFCYWRSYAVS